MGASAAWQAQVKVSGTAVAMLAEPCSLVSGTTYQVTNAAKRILDPAATFTVKDGGVPIPAANVTIDGLFGKFTLASAPVGAVTVDGSYLPVADIGEAKAVEVSVSVDLLDKSVFGSQAKTRLAALLDYSATVGQLALPITDIDPVTGGVQSLETRRSGGTPMLLDWLIDGTNRVRAWLLIKDYKVGGKVDGLVEVNINFEGSSQTLAAGFNIGIGT